MGRLQSSASRPRPTRDLLEARAPEEIFAATDLSARERMIAVPGPTNRVLTDGSHLRPRGATRMLGGVAGRRFLGS